MPVPFWLGITATVWGSVGGYSAPTCVALGFGRSISHIVSGSFTGDVGVVIWWHMAAGIESFVRAVSFLVNKYADSVKLIVRVSLPWPVCLVSTVGRRHPVPFAVRG